MIGSRPSLYWQICWKYLSPAAMILILMASVLEILVEGSGYQAWIASKGETEWREWPGWAVFLIVFLIAVSILWIPSLAILRWEDKFLFVEFFAEWCLQKCSCYSFCFNGLISDYRIRFTEHFTRPLSKTEIYPRAMKFTNRYLLHFVWVSFRHKPTAQLWMECTAHARFF